MKYLTKLISVLLLLTISQTVLQPLTQDVGTIIFGQNATYLIYVCKQPSPKVEQTLVKYCEGKSCAVLSEEIEEYETVRAFVGMEDDQYLLIIDVANRRKYTKPIKNSLLTEQQASQFYQGFKNGQLKRHLASQPVPEEQEFAYVTHLVGSTVSDFLSSPTPVKLIFLYTASELCDQCPAMLKNLVDLAKQVAHRDVIQFGFIDIFRNDHEEITVEEVPKLMVFQAGKKGRVIEMENASELEEIIKNVIGKKMNQGKPEEEVNEDEL